MDKATKPNGTPLRRGWTTGACATAATKSALSALLGHGFIDPVQITLPGGQTPSFALAHELANPEFAEAGIIKDAGDDPDVTHGASIIARISHGAPGSGIRFVAGEGVGTITKAGLPLDIGEAAINPVPRKMITQVIEEICKDKQCPADIGVEICVPDGENIAKKTWNPRLGIIGGISILGTTGIVIPYSCSAWIHSIHSGIDVARAQGLTHLVGSTGDTSEKAAQSFLGLHPDAYIDMGDFVGGMVKYLRKKPVEQITIAGGFAKISKLAQGAMDLHSGRSGVDMDWLGTLMENLGAGRQIMLQVHGANTGNEILHIAQSGRLNLAEIIADKAMEHVQKMLKQPDTMINILIVDREGQIVAKNGNSV